MNSLPTHIRNNASPASMANIARNPKLGDEWTINDLAAYNITIVKQNAATFFGQETLPLPHHLPDLLNHLTADDMESDDSYHVIRSMDMGIESSSR